MFERRSFIFATSDLDCQRVEIVTPFYRTAPPVSAMADATASPPLLPSHPRRQNQTLNAVSFGFIATAVLFAMFLIMAIFERILRPHRSFITRGRRDEEQADLPPEPSDKPELRHVNSYSRSVSVLMPGQDYPTYFARPLPSPLAPDGVEWPSHAESSQHTPNQKEPLYGKNVSFVNEKGATSQKAGTASD